MFKNKETKHCLFVHVHKYKNSLEVLRTLPTLQVNEQFVLFSELLYRRYFWMNSIVTPPGIYIKIKNDKILFVKEISHVRVNHAPISQISNRLQI